MAHKLLIADDSVTIQRVIELTFADEDIIVIAVGDGRQAIERVKADRPDIVLADVGMPERDGYEVAAFIKGTPDLAHIPVLLLTGAFEPIDEGRARSAQCDGVLVKPFEPQMVISRVKDLIAGKRPSADVALFAPGFSTADPAAGRAQAAALPSVDEYFDRLDAAFSVKEGSAPSTPAAPAIASDADIPAPDDTASLGAAGLASELAAWEPEQSLSAAAPPPAVSAQPAPASPASSAEAPESKPVAPPAPLPSLADAFAALLSAEQARPFAPAAHQALPDDVVEQITRRVIERMTDATVRTVVLDVAERLVREEIERIKQSN